MKDGFGREIDYVRISITDLCNLRCVYCMPKKGIQKLEYEDILRYEAILRIANVMARLGICKIKITGGEPLVRKQVAGLIGALKSIDGIKQVTLTTNGILLNEHASALSSAGIDGINVSLDTLDKLKYKEMTRGGDINNVLKGIDAAINFGIPVKINCVAVKGLNEFSAANVAALAQNRDIHVRFIEMMPIGLGRFFDGVSNTQIFSQLQTMYGNLKPCAQQLGNGPARYFNLAGFLGKIGFISAIGDCFCGGCNRIRLTADGFLKNCLHKNSNGINIKPVLYSGNDNELEKLVSRTIYQKPDQHSFESKSSYDWRIMSQIGG